MTGFGISRLCLLLEQRKNLFIVQYNIDEFFPSEQNLSRFASSLLETGAS